MAFQDYFSVVAFFIFLRETLEAAVIIAVLLQCMNRTSPRLKKQVWWGAACGIVGSIIAGGVFAAVYYVASTSAFSGNGKLIFQGCISYIACILITYLGFAMMRFSNIERKYMRKLDGAARAAMEKAKASQDTDTAPSRSHSWSVFILAASAVLREGIESVIFLAGVGSQSSFKAIPLACLAGLVVGLAVGFIIYYGGHSIKDLKVFFIISTIVLFFIAAGQVSLGTQLLSKVGMYGPYAAWADELSWQYTPVADLTHCCNDEFSGGNQFFVLAHAVLGYQARPTPVILIMYCFYWACVIAAVVYKWRNGSLFDADYKRKRTLLRLSRNADGVQRKLNRCNRRIGSLEAKLAAAAAGSSVAALEQQLATARQQQAQLQAQLEAAEAARDAEADRLEAEDAELAEAAAAAAGDQVLPVVAAAGGDKSDEGSSDSGSPAATALVSDLGSCKDTSIEMQELEQQQQKGKQGWLSKLRKH